MTQQEIVYAIHDFVAENEDEITFSLGEPIVVLEKDEKYMDGWWQGRNVHGDVGLFPMNYTSPTKSTLTAPAQNASLSSPLSTNSSRSSKSLSQGPASYTLEDQMDNTVSQAATDTQPSSVLTSSSKTNSRSSFTQMSNALTQLPPPSSSPPPPPPPHPTTTSSHESVSPADKAVTPSPPSSASRSANTSSPEDWTIEQVADWLKSVGLDNVVSNFVEQEITGDILVALTVDALKELGISAFGRRYKVMNAIEKLKAKTGLDNQAYTESKPPLQRLDLPANKTSPPLFASSGESHLSASPPISPIDSDHLYQFPRKAPLPPLGGMFDNNDRASRPRHPTSIVDMSASPMSPRSLVSPSVSRSNTFQTISSKISSSSSSGETSRSRERSQERNPAPAGVYRHTSVQRHMGVDDSEKIAAQKAPFAMQPSQSTDSYLKDRDPMTSLVTRDRNMSVASIDHQALAQMSDAQAPDYEGWLHKQGDKYKTWNKRWFVLKGPNLFYFKSPKDVRMKGIIHLRGYRVVVDDSIHGSKYSFKAQHENERTFYFYTDSQESLRTWIKMLMKATIVRDFGAPVMSSNHVATVSLDAAKRMRPRPPSVIMYKTHGAHEPHPGSVAGKMDTVQEKEEQQQQQQQQNHHLMPPHPFDRVDKQTRESGIVVYPHTGADGLTIPREIPVPGHALPPPTTQITSFQTTGMSVMVNMDDDEDLIDPQRRPVAAPASDLSPLLTPIHPTSPSPFGVAELHPEAPGQWNREQYLDWINQNLPPGKRVVDLSSAFRNGDTLILLLETLCGKPVRRSPPQKGGSVSMMMLDNIVAAFKFMGREGVVVDGRYTIKDIFSGDEDKIKEMLDSIREWSEKRAQESSPTPSSSLHPN